VVDDDDDLDESVVLAAHATQLLPESSEVMRPFLGRRAGHVVTLTSRVGVDLKPG
jgi:hypothetical protein